MKFAYLFVVLIALFTLSSCTSAVLEENNEERPIKNEPAPSTEPNEVQESPEYLAVNEGELSIQDSETAYEMCERALSDYYKAVWNGTDIELDTFIANENLKQYTQKKIQSEYDIYAQLNDVKDIKIDDWEVEYTDDVDGGFLYLKLPAEIIKTVGAFAEVTEFLVRNVNGKLVIVDWYTGRKDSYDFMVRGGNQTINNPDIWNNSEWVKKLDGIIKLNFSTR
ncbi:hypothetical protein [Paenibacillus pinihumi]|uniref:hypothetical protein n=1 Tax=Paenibacillus pinihumi TaxID=669462 RepID=UPI00048A66C0|nr:hypothetical protein [Paenibacillus pinihumi]